MVRLPAPRICTLLRLATDNHCSPANTHGAGRISVAARVIRARRLLPHPHCTAVGRQALPTLAMARITAAASGHHLDSTWLRLSLLRDEDFQDAVSAGGLDLLAIDAFRQDEPAVESTAAALNARGDV